MVTGTTPISGLPTGTIDNLQAIMPLSVGLPSTADTIQASLIQVAKFLGIQGFISENAGYLTYITGTSYRLEAGSAIVNDKMLTWSNPITRTGLTMTSGSMPYVYLYASGTSTAALEESTTAPVWDSTLSYYKKTNDPTRRCIGFLQALGVNTIRPFINIAKERISEFIYIDGVSDSGGKLLVNQVASTAAWTAIPMTNIVPVHTIEAWIIGKLILPTSADDGTLGLSPSDLGSASAALGLFQARGRAGANNANIFFGGTWLPVKETQNIYYRTLSNAGSPVAQVIVEGCRFIR